MGILRVLVPLIFAAFLAGCAAHIPVFETQDNVTTQPDRTLTAKVISEAKKPKPPAPKPATTASTNPQDTIKSIAPNVGSPQKWKKERAEDERKEQHLKQVIEGICRGC
ncbi:MAG TPA: hypothetical protein VFJ59_07545 [Pseudolabrys sp.]|nr:hypothetical protein [Pseudolabrys sp.]